MCEGSERKHRCRRVANREMPGLVGVNFDFEKGFSKGLKIT